MSIASAVPADRSSLAVPSARTASYDSFSAIAFHESGNIYVYSSFTEDQLQAAAEYVKEDYERNRDVMLLRPRG